MIKGYAVATLGSSTITFSLFTAMDLMSAAPDDVYLDSWQPIPIPDNREVTPPLEPDMKDYIVKKPEEVEIPKTIIVDHDQGDDTIPGLTPTPPPKPTAPFPTGTGLDFGTGTGEAVPLVAVQPTYPRRALERGIEGWIDIEFDLDASGSVIDARVVGGEPTGVFDRAALKAIQKFRFKPKMIDGQAYPSRGLRYRMRFSLNED